jgi:hypothetical protein
MSESVPGPVIATSFLLGAVTVDGLAFRGWETKLAQDVRPVLTGKSMTRLESISFNSSKTPENDELNRLHPWNAGIHIALYR